MAHYRPPPHNEPQLLPLCGQGEVALDIGANVGAWSYELLQRYKVVHAIEPQLECFADLRRLEEAYPNRYYIHRFAAWHNNGSLRLHVRRDSGLTNICGIDAAVDRPPISTEYDVACQPADFLNLAVDFIKIDTEGAELEVLKGLQTTLTRAKPTLLVEYHTAENRDWLMAWLTNRKGYQPQNLPINEQLGWILAKRQ